MIRCTHFASALAFLPFIAIFNLSYAKEATSTTTVAAPVTYGYVNATQCKCVDIEKCGDEMEAKTAECKDKEECTNHLSKIGDVKKILTCLDADHSLMLKLEECAKKKVNGELGCTNSDNPINITVPLIPVLEAPARFRRDAEEDEAQQAPQLASPPELSQYLACVDSCVMSDMDIIPGRRKKRSPVNCAFKLKCALAPPSESIQAAYSECEKELSIEPTSRLAESCNCLHNAGVTSLKCD
ncbi:hypothetical protein WR25_05173 isoform A [Diploscapter pachys]|uniref:Uncharacterized protein n=2 Tax=Diploscapter pachys TaxID=2018661 RepID=A0A2A2J5C9_9BILA|nr:hypothetical protein WR25_05173 isoform A [Diploscapter pachys]